MAPKVLQRLCARVGVVRRVWSRLDVRRPGLRTLLSCALLAQLSSPPAAAEATPAAAESAAGGALESEQPGGDILDFSLTDLLSVEVEMRTATRTSERSLDIDRSVNVVSRRQLREMQATSVPDGLSESLGVFIQKTNRSAGAPIIRGFVGPQNLLLVDGVRLNTATYRSGPLQYLNITDPFAFQRIEVVRGPGSVLYGSDAFGGTVQLLSEDVRFDRPLSATATAGIMSGDQSFVGNAGANGHYGPVGILIGGSYKNFELLRSGDDRLVPASDNQHFAGRAKVELRVSERLRLTGTYLVTAVKDAGRIDRLDRGDWRRNDNTDHVAYLRAHYQGDGTLAEATANISFQRLSEHVDRFNCDVASDGTVLDRASCALADRGAPGSIAGVNRYRALDDDVSVLGGFVTSTLRFLDGDLKLTGGLEAYNEWISSSASSARAVDDYAFVPTNGNFPDGSGFLRLGAFVHGRWVPLRFGADWKLSVNGGLRFAHERSSAPDVPGFGQVDQDFSAVVGTGGIVLANAERMAFYVNLAQGFRAPNLQETTQLGSSGAFFNVPNPDLKPERILSVEAGTKLTLGPIQATVALFDAELSDLISRVPATLAGASQVDGNQVVKRVNRGSGRSLGVEAGVSADYKQWRLFGHGTYVHGTTHGEDGAADEPARFIPPFFYLTGLRYAETDSGSGMPWYLQFHLRGAARKKRLAPGDLTDLRTCGSRSNPGTLKDPCDSVAPWVTLNVRGGARINKQLWFDLQLTNLTDWRYKSMVSGFDFSGFSAQATLTASY